MTVRIPRPEYHVSHVVDLDHLERGLIMYAITGNKPSQYGGYIGVGFAFDAPNQVAGRDYRDVDGKMLKRYERGFDSILGGQIDAREAKLSGFDRAIARYRATLRSK